MTKNTNEMRDATQPSTSGTGQVATSVVTAVASSTTVQIGARSAPAAIHFLEYHNSS